MVLDHFDLLLTLVSTTFYKEFAKQMNGTYQSEERAKTI